MITNLLTKYSILLIPSELNLAILSFPLRLKTLQFYAKQYSKPSNVKV